MGRVRNVLESHGLTVAFIQQVIEEGGYNNRALKQRLVLSEILGMAQVIRTLLEDEGSWDGDSEEDGSEDYEDSEEEDSDAESPSDFDRINTDENRQFIWDKAKFGGEKGEVLNKIELVALTAGRTNCSYEAACRLVSDVLD